MFVGYEEGIFSGYRFYETAAADGFYGEMTAENDPYYNRKNGVIYPFGLSYTSFDQKIKNTAYANGSFTFTDAVTRAYIYNDAHDGKRASDDVTVFNAFVREQTGANLSVANGDHTMNRAAGFEASWPTSPTAADCVCPLS